MKTKAEKIYAVEFMEYTNWEKVCVSSNPGQIDAEYLDFGKETCLVRESDLPIFQKYGHGFRSITCVGVLYVPEDVETFYDIFGGGFNVGINATAKKIVFNEFIIIIQRHKTP